MEPVRLKNTKGATKYLQPDSSTDMFGVGAVRANSNGGSTGNTGSCGINISCILCCCVSSGGGAENLKEQVRV